ncbi:Rieske (2Fe-2S) protein [Desulfococcus sp.]|uniref:Rieske (2Fe-2S) protein n=1 Tax=Desulfococcus sp. TaxID=2025834 RepID=UPI0035937C4C
MKLLKRILGICETRLPSVVDSWRYEDLRITVRLSRMPELRRPGGAVRLEGGGLPRKVLLVHGTDGRFHAFANRCTHMGRRLDPLPGNDRMECCSVSRSTFTYAGDPVSGAAKAPVETFPVDAEGDELRIRLG